MTPEAPLRRRPVFAISGWLMLVLALQLRK